MIMFLTAFTSNVISLLGIQIIYTFILSYSRNEPRCYTEDLTQRTSCDSSDPVVCLSSRTWLSIHFVNLHTCPIKCLLACWTTKPDKQDMSQASQPPQNASEFFENAISCLPSEIESLNAYNASLVEIHKSSRVATWENGAENQEIEAQAEHYTDE